MTAASTPSKHPMRAPRRLARVLTCAGLLAVGCALVACGTPSAPAPPLLHLGAAQPTSPPASVSGVGVDESWQLTQPLRVPAALEREAVMVSRQPGELVPWHGLRWSEPLRDALPRLLAQDLSALRGTERIWPGSPPAGVRVDRLLRVDVLAWDALESEGQVRMQVRWSLSDPEGKLPPRVRQAQLQQPWQPLTAGALVQAQRDLVQQLARTIAGAPA